MQSLAQLARAQDCESWDTESSSVRLIFFKQRLVFNGFSTRALGACSKGSTPLPLRL